MRRLRIFHTWLQADSNSRAKRKAGFERSESGTGTPARTAFAQAAGDQQYSSDRTRYGLHDRRNRPDFNVCQGAPNALAHGWSEICQRRGDIGLRAEGPDLVSWRRRFVFRWDKKWPRCG